MGNEVKATYDCTQPELYAICNLGWNYAKVRQSTIVLKFPEYTMAYIDGKIAEVAAAEALPGQQERELITETDRILLLGIATIAIEQWDMLERYINRLFKTNKALIKTNVEAAGKNFYEAATRPNPNWEDLKQMLIDGQDYITDHTSELTPIVPATFIADYSAALSAFITKYNTFTIDKFSSNEGTTEKVEANNALHDELMFMLADLQKVAPASQKDKFTFTHLKGIITTPGAAGLKNEVRASGTNILLAGALIKIQKEGGLVLEQTTDAEGIADFTNLPAGEYKGRIELTGYTPLDILVNITTGVHSFKHWVLVAV